MAKSDGAVIYQGLLARGFTPPQAAALTGNIQQESSFNPTALNADSGAEGLMQWRLDRRTGLAKYAKDTGRDPANVDTQLDYIVHEMTGPEKGNAASFLSSKDVQSANEALKKYIRYGKNEGGNRLQYAMSYADMPQGDTQVADAGQGGFVNPAFSGAMPAPPSFGAQPTANPAPNVAPATQAPAGGASGPSDDDLLKMFLPTDGGAPTGSGEASGQSADDAFLAPFLQGAPTEAETAAANPLANTREIFPGADALSAMFTSGVEALPIVGPSAMGALRNLKSGVQQMVYGQSQTPEQIAAIDKAVEAEQPVTSTVGSVAGTVGPYLVGGAIPGVARALGMTGNLLTRAGLGGASNALIQYADTKARGGSDDQARQNALVGGAIGAGAAPVADMIGAGFNRLIGEASPEVARLAQLARDKFGIPIGPGQMSDNQMIRFADSVVNKMPLSGGTASNAAQQTAFNRAIASTFGENADHITADVMAAARQRLGNDFDAVARRVTNIPYDLPFENALTRIESDAGSVLQSSEFGPLKRQLDELVNKFAQGNGITGEVYQALTRKGTPLDRLMSSDNPNIAYYAGQMRDALDDVLARNAPQDAQELLTRARTQYKALKTVEPLVEKAATGDISPALLNGRVNANYSGTAYGGGGDLKELAQIGQRFLKAPPSSGTSERLAVMELGKKLAGPAGIAGGITTAALNPGAIPMMLATGIPAAAGYTALARGAGAALRSDALANRLIQNSLGGAADSPIINRLVRSAVPLAPEKAIVNDVFQGVPGPNNGQSVTVLRPSKDGNGYIVQLSNGQQTYVGKNLLTSPAQ